MADSHPPAVNSPTCRCHAATNFHQCCGSGFHSSCYDWILDLAPRNLLSLAVGVGGVLVPILWRGTRRWPDSDQRHWLWPTIVCLPAAAVASFVRIPERIATVTGTELTPALDISAGETEEWALAFVIMTYMLSLRARLRDKVADDEH